MQSLYALKQSRIANYHNALASMEEVFAPNLLAEEKQDLRLLQEKKNKATACLEEYFKTKSDDCAGQEVEIKKAVNQAIAEYNNQGEKDKRHFRKILETEIEGIFENYIQVLSFLDQLAEYSIPSGSEEKNKTAGASAFANKIQKFGSNKITEQIRNNKEYISNRSKGKLVWDNNLVRNVFRNLKNDKALQEYLDKMEKTFDDDKEIVLHIAKEIIFKSESLLSFFEEKDIKWQENKTIVKSMVVKTLKSAEEQNEIKLLAISANWEEDKLFYEDLYQKTIERNEEFEKFVSEKIENWDIERLAALDRIILVMAISEMVNFSSIPVKVTINEYIELSKLYSTPKSKQFINGILDKLSEDLIKSGMIRKSGRGLIDNK